MGDNSSLRVRPSLPDDVTVRDFDKTEVTTYVREQTECLELLLVGSYLADAHAVDAIIHRRPSDERYLLATTFLVWFRDPEEAEEKPPHDDVIHAERYDLTSVDEVQFYDTLERSPVTARDGIAYLDECLDGQITGGIDAR